MPDLSELSQKYREELLRMYSTRKPEPEEPKPTPEPEPEPQPEPIPEPEPIEEITPELLLPEEIQPEIPVIPSQWKAQEEYENRNTETGRLYVVTSTADNAYPVPDSRVTIYTRIGDKLQLNYLLVTNESGRTPVVTLPAPPAQLSQNPDEKQPYALCDIKVYAKGYFREEARDVPIFAGVTSRQGFQMIPLPAGVEEDSETIVFSGGEN